jgi:hypothetical protein
VLDNECCGETGGQASHTACTVDFVGIARSCGISDARSLATMAETEAYATLLQHVTFEPRFASIKIDSANLERVLVNRDGTFPISRIRHSLGFQPI